MSKPKWIALALIGLLVVSAAAWQAPRVRSALYRRVADFVDRQVGPHLQRLERRLEETERRLEEMARPTRVALLEELQPVALKNCTLKRFGSANDGGYLLCDNLSEGIKSAYSYGVGPNDDFGCDVSKRYRVAVHQYDCFDPARPTCEGGVFAFNNECIGPRPERDTSQRIFDTLEGHISKNLDTGKRLIVKIDVEGAEWDSLLVTPDAVLDQIDQIAMELHGVSEQRFLGVIRRLKQKFYLVNLHFNNYRCSQMLEPLAAWVYQVLLVNKRLGVLDESATKPAPMSELNAPDNLQAPDCQLSSGRK